MAASHQVHETITLNEEEKELLGTLLEAAQHAGSGTVLRCAGGWVRDKLLGRDSLDIDVALDNMMGKDFADLVNLHLQSKVGRWEALPCMHHSHALILHSHSSQSAPSLNLFNAVRGRNSDLLLLSKATPTRASILRRPG